MHRTESPNNGKLTGIGTINPDNRLVPPTCKTRNLEVVIEQDHVKTAVQLSLLIPTKRSEKGSRRVTELNLTGAQARKLYETLGKHFEWQQSHRLTREELSNPEKD